VVCERSLPKIKIEQEGEGSCGRASEGVRGRVRRVQKVGIALVGSSRGDRGAGGT